MIHGVSAVHGSGRTWPNDPRAPGLTLAQAFIIFARRRSPRMLVFGVVMWATLRLWAGPLHWADLMLAVGLVLFQPFSEWLIHVGILHWRPRRILGVKVDPYLSWSHREHHKLPYDEKWWFIPTRSTLIGGTIIGAIGWVLLRDVSLWMTLMLTATLMTTIYEWTHYLSHSSYRPRGRLYKRIWRHHRWHHFKNEHYWMGVSRHFADWVLGTNPDPKSVETSPTCRDLLAEDDRERDAA